MQSLFLLMDALSSVRPYAQKCSQNSRGRAPVVRRAGKLWLWALFALISSSVPVLLSCPSPVSKSHSSLTAYPFIKFHRVEQSLTGSLFTTRLHVLSVCPEPLHGNWFLPSVWLIFPKAITSGQFHSTGRSLRFSAFVFGWGGCKVVVHY